MVATLLKSSGQTTTTSSTREQCLELAEQHYEQARLNAEAGQMSEAAQLILKALDQERRAGSVGPQVMQLIKPRSVSAWGNRS